MRMARHGETNCGYNVAISHPSVVTMAAVQPVPTCSNLLGPVGTLNMEHQEVHLGPQRAVLRFLTPQMFNALCRLGYALPAEVLHRL